MRLRQGFAQPALTPIQTFYWDDVYTVGYTVSISDNRRYIPCGAGGGGFRGDVLEDVLKELVEKPVRAGDEIVSAFAHNILPLSFIFCFGENPKLYGESPVLCGEFPVLCGVQYACFV